MLSDIIFYIFTFLSEYDLCKCMRVCSQWKRIAHSSQFLYPPKRSTLPLIKVILQCCQDNRPLSFIRAVNCIPHINPPPQINYYMLWNDCLTICCQHGYIILARKILTFVSTIRRSELIGEAKKHGHMNIVKILQEH